MFDRSNKHILVVDDEPLFVASVVDALVHQGYQYVAAAADGREALERAEQESFDLLLTDLNMPVMGGVELLAGLSGVGFRGRILVISAYLDEATERAVRQLGAVACLEKPIDLDGLVDLVDASLSRPESILDGLSVTGFVQLLEAERKSCLLRVLARGRKGDLLFEDGQLIDALTEDADGDRAALDILAWSDPVLQLLESPKGHRRRTTLPLSHLLLESARLLDEAGKRKVAEPAGKAAGRKPGDPGVKTGKKSRPPSADTPGVQDTLARLMAIEGAIGASMVDLDSGTALGTAGGDDRVDVDVASAGNTLVIKAKMQVLQRLGLPPKIEEVLVSLETQYHVIRPLERGPGTFLFLVLERKRCNLGMVRHQLGKIEAGLEA